MTTSSHRRLMGALASLTVLGTLAACSSEDSAQASEGTAAPSSQASSTDSGAQAETDAPDAEAGSGSYADGTYEATGSYVSPGGQESIDVVLTIAGNAVADVTVTSLAENPNSVRYQGEFVGGIADEIVGVAIDDLNVDKVAGSSLTSGGFNDALETIKAEARG